ncbi:MAG: ABC transporter permease [Bifidobacteriaceae bacterium]|nr:ABC transporter permease [Bifidobacteriaceae bacterium]
MILLLVVSALAPWLAPHNPEEMNLLGRYAPPSAEFPFGTDDLGRCVLSRVIWGGRPVLAVTVAATALSVAAGVILGALTVGNRWLDIVLTRLADVQLSIPGLVLALLAVTLLGTSLVNIVVVLALTAWPLHFRVVRTHCRMVKRLPFDEASVLAGTKWPRRAIDNYLPGIASVLAATVGVNAAGSALATAGLSYLGLGVTQADWGHMIAATKGHLADAVWAPGFPSLALVALLLGIQLIAANRSGAALVIGTEKT